MFSLAVCLRDKEATTMASQENSRYRSQHDNQDRTDDLPNFGIEPRPFTSSASRSRENNLHDELIVSLSNAYENKRARQVTEWEFRQSVRRAV
jgi:hypothetical protein